MTLPFDGIDDLRSHYRFDNQQSFLDLYYQLMSVLRTREDFSDLMFDYLRMRTLTGCTVRRSSSTLRYT